MENAQKEAVKLKSDKIGTEHLLIAMLRMEDIVATRLLNSMSINIQKVYVDLMVSCGADGNAAKRNLLPLKM